MNTKHHEIIKMLQVYGVGMPEGVHPKRLYKERSIIGASHIAAKKVPYLSEYRVYLNIRFI